MKTILIEQRVINDSSRIINETSDENIVVSLTTYNKRIYDVHLVIESIAQQTIKPNGIVLWLDEQEFNLENIPKVIKRQISRGLDVRFCSNIRSYKKLIPTIEKYQGRDVVTIDDDVLYPYDFLEILLKTRKKHPNSIIANRVHRISVDDLGSPLSYDDWEKDVSDNITHRLNVAIGVGGILYPQSFLSDSDILNESLFMKLAPNADDLWFKFMAEKNNISVVKSHDNRDFWRRFLLLESGQDIGLKQKNVSCKMNDKQFNKLNSEFKLF
ncbi:glycosyl transferase [uncultured Vibrio sp.]|uniref:glycosyl transferase n=1 Tax=uncultured Vibrio sp. TaxID=114054 RepID=UPI00262D61C7|nr:glycosyl transferase [uncultured Vibrio sp.]